MIYTASQPSKLVPSTKEFVARALTGLTIGRLGEINMFGKPTEHQLAYDGYKANIECFLAATALGKKVSTRIEHHPFPASYTPTVTLPLPQVVFQLQGNPTAADLKKLEGKLEKEGMERLQIKNKNTFVLKKPSATSIRNLSKMCPPTCAFLEGYAQLIGASSLLPIYEFVDAFLATHTYSYKKSDGAWNPAIDIYHPLPLEIRTESAFYRQGYNKNTKMPQFGKPITSYMKIDEAEPQDLTPLMSSHVPASAVLIAKPSKVPSSKSFGTPSEVPNHPGLLFPYFEGLVSHDTRFIRSVISSVFFRNLGDENTTPRDAYVKMKENMGTATTTPQGDILGHVLKGVEMALDCQAQLYLLLDKQNYFGFILLGEEFSVFAHGKWISPMSAEKLREELDTLLTHDQVLDKLVVTLSRCNFEDSSQMVARADIDTPDLLMDILAEVDMKSTDEKQIEAVSELLKNLTFPGSYRRINAENIEWAISTIVEGKGSGLGDEKLYVPYKDWSGIESIVFQTLAAFGTQSFSLIEPRGEEVAIPRSSSDASFYEIDSTGKVAKDKRLVVYEKNLRQCVKDWEQVIKSGRIKMALKERAAGSRGVMFTGEGLIRVWKAIQLLVPLIEKAESGKRVAEDKGEGPSTKKAKVAKDLSSIGDVLDSW